MWKTSLCAVVVGMMVSAGAMAAEPLVPEMEGWGTLRGVRDRGQFFPIQTELRVPSPGWQKIAAMARWDVKDVKSAVRGAIHEYTGRIDLGNAPILYREQVQSRGGAIVIHVEATAQQAMQAEGVFFFVSVPVEKLSGGTARLIGGKVASATIPPAAPQQPHFLDGEAAAVELLRGETKVQVKPDRPRPISVQDNRKWGTDTYSVYFPLHQGNLAAGQKVTGDIELKVTTALDTQAVKLTVDTSQVTHTLDGFGGNFVFGPDSPVAKYNLEHLNVAYGRIWAALHEWEPENDNADDSATDTAKLAAYDRPGTNMRASMEIAQELQKRKIPYVASAWPLPKWLLVKPWEKDPFTHQAQIAPGKWEEMAECVSSYLVYAKEKYGVEPDMFSFNEPDWGVMLKLTPEEHRDAIKMLGARFEQLGLRTKLLLGDVTNARDTAAYVDPTIADPEAMKYVQAIAFHSWGGATDEQFAAWHERAARAKRPLLVTEAGVDAEAWHYAGVFDEYWYAMSEARQYQQLLSTARPQGILLWEYTRDYGIVDMDGSKTPAALTPSKRFHFLQQLATRTPKGGQGLQTNSSRPDVLVTAFRDASGRLTLHIVNDGAAREAAISGLPSRVKAMDAVVTDLSRNCASYEPVTMSSPSLRVKLPAWSLVTLSEPPLTMTAR